MTRTTKNLKEAKLSEQKTLNRRQELMAKFSKEQMGWGWAWHGETESHPPIIFRYS